MDRIRKPMAATAKRLKIWCVSDVHLEFYNNARKLYRQLNPFPVADVLCLNGDIGKPNGVLEDFLLHVNTKYPHVLYIPGNHEFYGVQGNDNEMKAREEALVKLCEQTGTVYMHRQVKTIQHVTFVGCTLWSELSEDGARIMNDIGAVYRTREQYVANHQADKAWLTSTLTRLKESRVQNVAVMTHHLPTFDMIHPRFEHLDGSGYASHLLQELGEIASPICLWMSGHTHEHVRMHSDQQSCILWANPFGYPGERRETRLDKECIEL